MWIGLNERLPQTSLQQVCIGKAHLVQFSSGNVGFIQPGYNLAGDVVRLCTIDEVSAKLVGVNIAVTLSPC